MSFFRKEKPDDEIPVGAEREDILADIARRAGERKQQVQTLLEEYARQQDAPPQEVASATFRTVLNQVEPKFASQPEAQERRWSTVREIAPPVAPQATQKPDTADALETRVATLEREQKKLVGIVEALIGVISETRGSKVRAASKR